MNNDFASIEYSTLDTVTGGGKFSTLVNAGKKALEYGKKAGSWTVDNVIKPGAAAVGFDYVFDKVTGHNRTAAPEK